MLYLHLFYEFFKIGLFSFGGGYATIPFLYHISQVYGWFSPNDLERMIAISSVTPGPVGVNMATFAGMQTGDICGSLIATTAIVLPALFIVVIVSRILRKFQDNFYVKSALYGLKPASCALLAVVAFNLIRSNLLDIYSIGLFLVFILISLFTKKDPLFYLFSTGLIGLVLKLLSLV